MAETPEERLARLRREVEGTWTPPVDVPPAEDVTPAVDVPSETDASSAPDLPPAREPRAAADASPDVGPAPVPDPPRVSPRPTLVAPAAPAPPAPTPPAKEPPDDDGWSLADAIGSATVGTWVAIGLVGLGGYLLLSQVLPGLTFPGSILLAIAGFALLWRHFAHRAGAWALYAGAILAAVGSLRVIGSLVPLFEVRGETALGVGIALLAIAVLRHSQAGGYGWQGVAGVIALAWGVLQFLLGLLPGSPGILDLVLPALILAGGVFLLLRTLSSRRT